MCQYLIPLSKMKHSEDSDISAASFNKYEGKQYYQQFVFFFTFSAEGIVNRILCPVRRTKNIFCSRLKSK